MLCAGCGSGASESGVDPKPTVTGVTRWFAIRTVRLGLTNVSTGAADANAWKDFGFDLDGRYTTREDSKTSRGSCKRAEGSPTNVLADGNNGRDNNFGQHFMSIVKSLQSDVEERSNGSIADGTQTILLRLDNVTGRDNASVPGALYLAGSRGSAPSFDGTDEWPIDQSTLDSTGQPLARFPNGFVAAGAWVSGQGGNTVTKVPMPLWPGWVHVPLESAIVTFNTTTNNAGTIAGAVGVADFKMVIEPLFPGIGICPGDATSEQISSTIGLIPDLVLGAPNLQDTSAICNAISIGIGFSVTPIAAPTSTVAAKAPPASTCPP